LLNLYNTLTGKTELFQPAQNKQVKMYTCGPSTYQWAHIGNYRTFLFEDILQRYMEYCGYKVIRLITLTDVEDKAISQAKKESLTVSQLTEKNEAVFFQDFKLLKIKTPDYSVRASSAVDQAAALIAQLVNKGFAYWFRYKGVNNAYFEPLKFGGFGKLVHLDMSKWPKKKRRFHKDTYPGTPWNKGDFIVWHGCGFENVCYETPIGSGRPAWNIQDAAIVTKHLGFQIDIACGGIDNLVRHHDYTLAIAESVSDNSFSKYWLHGGHLFVDGKKMSKSTGNVYYTSDVLAKGFSGEQLRFFLIYGPYREKLNFTFDRLSKTSKKLDSLKEMIFELQQQKSDEGSIETKKLAQSVLPLFEEAMDNNLDVKGAFDNLYEIISELHKKSALLEVSDGENLLLDLHKIDSVLQCLF
jgi:cysteinyl-tRNA synthetase